uniref:Uncharacterized protein n=1 Tax=Arundo donax TaxID=35708 RepID=A0A0A9HFG7_ARUDO
MIPRRLKPLLIRSTRSVMRLMLQWSLSSRRLKRNSMKIQHLTMQLTHRNAQN